MIVGPTFFSSPAGGGYAESVLLLHLDSDFTDSSPKANAPTLVGSPSPGATAKFGAGGGRAQGSSDYVTYADAAWLDFGGDRVFSIDFWMYIAPGTTSGFGHTPVLTKVGTTTAENSWAVSMVFVNAIEFVCYRAGGLSYLFRNFTATSPLPQGSWFHVAIWKTADKTMRGALNGVIEKTYTGLSGDNLIDAGTGKVKLFGDPFGGTIFGASAPSGVYVDEVRICVDVIDYDSSNFTPPPAPYP